ARDDLLRPDALPGALRRQDDALAPPGQRLAEDLLAEAVAVARRGVDVGDAARERPLDRRQGGPPPLERPWVPAGRPADPAEREAAQADPRDPQAGPAERAVLHGEPNRTRGRRPRRRVLPSATRARRGWRRRGGRGRRRALDRRGDAESGGG